MSISSSEAKAIDTCPTLAKRPGLLASCDLQAPLIEGDVLIRVFEVVIWEDKATLQHQRSLDHSCDAWDR